MAALVLARGLLVQAMLARTLRALLLTRELVLLALLLARELLVQAILARVLRALLLMLLMQAELLLARTSREFLVSLLPLEVFAACFGSAVASGFS